MTPAASASMALAVAGRWLESASFGCRTNGDGLPRLFPSIGGLLR